MRSLVDQDGKLLHPASLARAGAAVDSLQLVVYDKEIVQNKLVCVGMFGGLDYHCVVVLFVKVECVASYSALKTWPSQTMPTVGC